MARRRAPEVLRAELEPQDWPAWLLAFDRGWHDDPGVQEAIRLRFHDWRAARSTWAAEHRPDLTPSRFALLASAEHRRRWTRSGGQQS